ncbi:MAG: sensor domain-containing diguanylate cyclase [Erysipelotrichaceae bacterium]
MTEKFKIENIDIDELKSFEKFIAFPIILFNEADIFYVNESFKELCLLHTDPSSEINVEKLTRDPRVLAYVKTALQTKRQASLEVDFHREGQPDCWVELSGKAVHYRGYDAVLASISDITEEKKVKEDLSRISRLRMLMLEVTQSVLESEDLEQLFKLILDNALKALTNGSLGTILMKERTYFSVASYVGYDADIINFRLPIEDAFIYQLTEGRMDRIVRIPDLLSIRKYYLNRTIYGEERFIKSTISAPIYIKGSLFGIISIDALETDAFDDDDERSMEFIRNTIEIALANHLSYQEKAFLARYDRLTNLYNRTYFEEQFALVKDLAQRYEDDFNIVMIDIDNLKTINDCYGHLVGDRAIQHIAKELERNTRSSDFIARYGGDEFIGIFYHTDHALLEEKFANLLRRLSDEPMKVGSDEVVCQFSFGIADYPKDGGTMNELIKVADDRMYRFKGHAKR